MAKDSIINWIMGVWEVQPMLEAVDKAHSLIYNPKSFSWIYNQYLKLYFWLL